MPTAMPCAGSLTEGAALAATAECEDDQVRQSCRQAPRPGI